MSRVTVRAAKDASRLVQLHGTRAAEVAVSDWMVATAGPSPDRMAHTYDVARAALELLHRRALGRPASLYPRP